MKRQFLILLAALVALAGSITAALATQSARDFDLRGYVDAAQTRDLPPRIPRLGVNVDLTQYSAAELSTQLDLMRAANVTWLRQFVRWSDIEPQSGAFDWSAWDRITAALENDEQLRLVAVLFTSPTWARDSSLTSETAPPADPSVFARFAAAFAERYGSLIDYYQIWDEPNLYDAWGEQDPRPADYVALLAQTAPAIRAADSHASILAAALAPTIETGGRNISDILYLEDLYALGANQFVDAFAAKPYGFSLPPSDRRVERDLLNFSRVVALREIMAAHGDSAMPLWISEFGWNTLPPHWSGAPSIWGQVTLSQQTSYTLDALRRADREWAWLGGMILAHWQPNVEPNHPLWGFSTIDTTGAPTPLYSALTAYSEPTAAHNGFYPAVNPHAQYSGVWTFSPLGADIGWLQDSRLAFTFEGRAVSLLLRQDNYVAFLYPTVDDLPANATPHDASGNAFINLKSDDLTPQLELVPVSRDLSPGVHLLRAAADRGWDRWAIVGYAVSSGDLAQPYNYQIAIAWLAAVISALAVLATAAQIDWQPVFRRIAAFITGLGSITQIAVSAVTSIALMIGMLLTWKDGTPELFRRDSVQLGLAVFTGGLIYIQPHVIVILVAGAALFVLIFHRLELGLMLTIFYAPFFLFPVELYRFAFPMSELVLLITTSAAILRGLIWLGRSRQSSLVSLPNSPLFAGWAGIDVAMLAVGILALVSLLWTQYRDPAITELRTLIAEPLAFYAVLRAIRPTRTTLLRISDSMLIAAVVVAIIGMFMFLRGEGIITAEGGTMRLASVYGSPNNVGLFLGRCIPFALAFLILPLDRPRRIYAAIALGIMSVAILLTLSAGALFIGIPAATITVLLLAWGKRAFIPITAIAGISMIGAFIAVQSERFARLLDFTGGTNFFRVRLWQSTFQMLAERPITGLGMDQFLYAFRGRFMLPDAWEEPDLSHPHNILLDFWTRLGIAGILLLLWIQIAFWRASFALYRHYRAVDSLALALTIGAMGSMINLLAHGMVDNAVFVQDLAYVFVLIVGIVVSLRTSELLTHPAK